MDILKDFKITSYYKYLLYLAGILLILSLSIEIKIISNIKLMIFSFITIIYGINCWMYEGHMKNYADNINLAWQHELSKPKDNIKLALSNEDPYKEFREKYDSIKLSKEYKRMRIIMFLIYIIILTLFIIFIK